jgi:hypothetical protein
METSRMKTRLTTPAVALLGLALAAPLSAQTPPGSGPLVVEELREGFTVTPENRFTDLDGALGNLVGGSIGVLTDETFFVGGAGYWLSDGDRRTSLAYGGLVAEWTPLRSGRVGLALRGLVGAGSGSLPTEVTLRSPGFRSGPHRFGGGPPGSVRGGEPVTATVGLQGGFFVLEPQASVTLKVVRWMRLGVGVGYRRVDGAGSLDERLSGVSGNVSLQLGSF